ncbi:glycosyltransferase family 2 protein [Maribacter chungangensis]|uniref:Glycosyltransferase family 2 protein n=1 Tax=Maribacter chungangensis TaxID=1069117 RepID=A0ABW3B558_9FLAO
MKELNHTSDSFLFSVITINYNNRAGLESTFKSVSEQDFKDFEFIIVDGNSQDGSMDFLSKVKTPNLKIISENDNGIYDAMNKGIRNATGAYIIFMNSGDCFSGSFVLGRIHAVLNGHHTKLKFIYGDTFEKEAHGDMKHYKKAKNHTLAWYGMFAHHQSMVFAKDTLIKEKLFYNLNYELAADWDFVLKFIKNLKNEEIKYLNMPFAVFELGGVSSKYIQGIREQYKIRRDELAWNRFKCLVLSSLHFTLNLIRERIPVVYLIFLKLRSRI